MIDTEKDPLDELITKASEVEGEYRLLLANILKPHVRMDLDTGKIYFIQRPPKLNTKQHVLVYLLAKLALAQKNPDFEPIVTPKEIEENTGIPGGTVRPKLGELLKERIISRGEAGYFVEVMSLYRAKSLLEDTLSESKK